MKQAYAGETEREKRKEKGETISAGLSSFVGSI
jgi:hypothetical protein